MDWHSLLRALLATHALLFLGGLIMLLLLLAGMLRQQRNPTASAACPETSLLVIVTFIVMPLQLLIGDAAGRVMVEHQPAKLAAIEAHWHTNFPEKARPGRYWPGRFPSGRPIAGHYCERRTGAMV